MKILMTGATGFIGRQAALHLRDQGHELVVLSRDPERARVRLPVSCPVYPWKDIGQAPPGEALEGVEAVIHLAGENIFGRWNRKKKNRIVRSRVESTRRLVESWLTAAQKPAVFVSISGIGFYGDRGDEVLNESASRGEGFLPDLCRQWEQEARNAETLGMRTVQLRTGMVLGPDGGAMGAMLPLFRLGLGGRIGSGTQWLSWIHIRDLVGLIHHALETPSLSGPVNAVSPHPVSNAEFTRTLGKMLRRPTLFPIPAFLLEGVLKEAGRVALDSQRGQPQKALDSGYVFTYPELEEALGEVCGHDYHELLMEQWVPQPIDKVFAFFSDAANLELITPPHLSFKIVGQSTESLQEGTRIDYKLQLHGIPFRWQSLIHDWRPPICFSDSQERGPYKKWYHTHIFIEKNGGTLIRDHALYQIPLGTPGDSVAYPLVRRDLEKIFGYRFNRVREIFGE